MTIKSLRMIVMMIHSAPMVRNHSAEKTGKFSILRWIYHLSSTKKKIKPGKYTASHVGSKRCINWISVIMAEVSINATTRELTIHRNRLKPCVLADSISIILSSRILLDEIAARSADQVHVPDGLILFLIDMRQIL